MLSNDVIEQRFKTLNEVAQVKVTGDGHHFELELVSDVFVGLSTLARQKWVYAHLNDLIKTGILHALTMKTWTQDEWEREHG